MSAKILPFAKPQESNPAKGDAENEEYPEIVDLKWQDKIIMQYAPLVKYIADRLALRLPPHISKDDLISSGIIGLIDAIRKFDPGKNIKFKTYAEFRIKGAMLDEMRNLDWIPRSVRKKQHLLEKTHKELQITLGRPAEPEEIAETLGIEMEEFHELLDITKSLSLLDIEKSWRLSPDDKYNPDGTLNKNEKGDPLQALSLFQSQNIVAQCIKEFPYGMQLLISLYFYEELTMWEISLLAGCTESRISQLFAKALREMKPKLAKRLGISNYTSAIYTDRHRERPLKKSLISFPKTLIWNPEKPGDDDPKEKRAPYGWKNFARKISERIFSLHIKKGEEKMKERKPGRIPGITTLGISYRTVLCLRELGITKTDDLLALTSEQFVQKCSGLNSRSIRAIAVKMIINDLDFQDGREATRCLENYDPKTYTPFVEKLEPAAPPPEAPAATAAEPDPASFEAIFRKIGSALDNFLKEASVMSPISFSGYVKSPAGNQYSITISEVVAPAAE